MAALNMCGRAIRSLSGINSTLLQKTVTNRASVSWFSRSQTNGNAEASAAEQEGKAEQSTNGAEHATAEAQGPSQAEVKLQAENENLAKKLKDLDDKYKRSLAETENTRRRLKKQADDAKIFGIQGFCKDLLDVADTLNKAVESVPEDVLNSSSNAPLNDLYKGLKMTEGELKQVFNRHGLVVIAPEEGEPFDPNFHEALFVQPAGEGKVADTVMVMTKTGYKLHERTIRPALVGVYK